MNTTEEQLKKLKSTIALRASEKAAHKQQLLSFMASRRPIPSPFTSFIFYGRYAALVLLLLVVTGGGVAAAAEGVVPGNPLYVVKVRVTEPARVALTQDPQKRADLEVTLIERRFREFAQVSVQQRTEAESDITDLIVSSLEERLEDAHKNIATLKGKRGVTDALDASVELYATLAAYDEVLDRISERHPDAVSDIEIVQDTVQDKLDEVKVVVALLRSEVDLEDETANSLYAAIEREQKEVESSLEDIAEHLTGNSFDADDHEELNDSLTQIRTVVEAASQRNQEGNRKEALKLFGEVSEQVTRLRTLVEADRALGLDLIRARTERRDASSENN